MPRMPKGRKRSIQLDGEKSSARNPTISFLETRKAWGSAIYVSWNQNTWKRNTRRICVSFLCFIFLCFDFDRIQLLKYRIYSYIRMHIHINNKQLYVAYGWLGASLGILNRNQKP